MISIVIDAIEYGYIPGLFVIMRTLLYSSAFAFAGLYFKSVEHKVKEEPVVSQEELVVSEDLIEQIVEIPVANISDKTEEIRNYKKVLDDGIITEEEFQAKKKQLLGL